MQLGHEKSRKRISDRRKLVAKGEINSQDADGTRGAKSPRPPEAHVASCHNMLLFPPVGNHSTPETRNVTESRVRTSRPSQMCRGSLGSLEEADDSHKLKRKNRGAENTYDIGFLPRISRRGHGAASCRERWGTSEL